MGLVNRPNDVSLSRGNQSQAKFKSAVDRNLLQSWVNLTIVSNHLFPPFLVLRCFCNMLKIYRFPVADMIHQLLSLLIMFIVTIILMALCTLHMCKCLLNCSSFTFLYLWMVLVKVYLCNGVLTSLEPFIILSTAL